MGHRHFSSYNTGSMAVTRPFLLVKVKTEIKQMTLGSSTGSGTLQGKKVQASSSTTLIIERLKSTRLIRFIGIIEVNV